MTRDQIISEIKAKKSLLCVGLDTDLQRIPKFLLEYDDPIFEFNKRIIDNTKDLVIAYKPNFAFYEALGSKGWDALQKTVDYIPKNIFTIADAKRGDIGNTSTHYAKAILENLNFDSITLSPYMGKDSISPYLTFKHKWVITLAYTSNASNKDLQILTTRDHSLFYEKVITSTKEYSNSENMMYVVGATSEINHLKKIRALAPDHFFLVPGIGAQGGSLKDVIEHASNKDYGLIINSSRGIIYASDKEDFADAARHSALRLVEKMRLLVNF